MYMNFVYTIFVSVILFGAYSAHGADQYNQRQHQFVSLHFSVPYEVKSLVQNGNTKVEIPINSTVGDLITALQVKLHIDFEIGLMCEGHMNSLLAENEKIKWTTYYVAIRKPKKQV
jgi:hypothetical protein